MPLQNAYYAFHSFTQLADHQEWNQHVKIPHKQSYYIFILFTGSPVFVYVYYNVWCYINMPD